MPIIDTRDATDVDEHIERIFAADSTDGRVLAIRRLFAEKLDFVQQSGAVGLSGAAGNARLPDAAHRIASLEGAQVVYVDLSEARTDTNRVRKAEAVAAAKIVSDSISDDPLLVFTNRDASQLHLVYPSFERAQPTLRRLVVERDLPRRTAVQQVANIYHQWRDTGSLHTALERAFDVEAVTAAFFDEYKRVFDIAMGGVEGFGGGEEEQERKKLFVQTLFNRLMFVYFLSRKGWLTFKGHNDYLNALWRDYQSGEDDGSFYGTRLKLLFFSGLNNPQSQNLMRDNPALYELIGDVPFLNGGLFQKSELDDRVGLSVPDGAIEPVLTDLFDRFNFTVMESTPFDIEVAVDPEMLGKVFEELVTGRHDSGSYYTPRPVVSFMCREALKGYLEGKDTGADAAAIARFVDERDAEKIGLAPARRVSAALSEVTVVDPACGSGAYLLGMMQELIELQNTLYNVGVNAKSLYDLKLEIIQRNLYGVDLDDFAVNIAMLRMWLSLAIDYEGERPEPLPNLDFKVVQGDSLLGPDPSQLNLERGIIEKSDIGNLKGAYMRATVDKSELRRQVLETEERLRADLSIAAVPEGIVDWRIEFAEVFAGGGFDVAIANPPYISVENLTDETKEHLFNNYVTCERRTDIYVGFLERALSLVNSGGLLSFIIPASFTKQKYATKMRQKLIGEHSIKYLVDTSSYRIFENAVVYNVILGVAKQESITPTKILIHQSNADFESRAGTEFSVDQKSFASLKDSRFDTNPNLPGAITIRQKAWRNAVRLDQICLVAYGARLNHRSKKIGKAHYISQAQTRGAKRFCEGSNIERFHFSQEGWLKYKSREHYNPMFPELFENEKLMCIRIVKEHLRFAYDGNGFYNSHTVINCVRLDKLRDASHRTAVKAVKQGDTELAKQFDYKYLLAVLNSTFTTWYFRNFLSDNLNFYPNDAKELPIPKISVAEQRPFVRLVDAILEAKAADAEADTEGLEWRIDGLVYELYGLTEEEDTAIERALGLIHQTDEEEDAAIARAIEAAIAEEPREYVSEEEAMTALRDVDGSEEK